ncbi:FAD-dependent oxidoreductase [Paenibacillus sp. Marseille-P2973]|uniref:FAD-dependent oxidoreductase n=1 Tax=Paenibacillus sp. Marseille-P2973 TaxID=1871032 RepID=UPI001B38205C|nr:FAD-dependent oxidoreductase [Paenibacillus sp. Marseille-P2973]MBQ4902038.1 FAD-dependent oxidoreductase [Paenibacillus sp. Marseille-P2973]
MVRDERIGIVGAGISGVTLAHELAKKGYSHVTIMEKEDRVGGKCHSIEYKGKTYEMGALIGLPSYKMTMELMKEFGLKESGPLLERGFFNREGHKISQIPKEQMSDFAKEFKRLPALFGRYESLKAPGLEHIPSDLCKPFACWCDENGLFVLKQVFMHYFSAFGYGSIDEVPAAYVMKLLNFDNLMSFIEITPMITWPQGVTDLVKCMGDRASDLRLTCEVNRIAREAPGKVRVETNQGNLYFDKVIYTASLRDLPDKTDLEEEDRKLLKKIFHERFRVYAYRVDNIPKLSGYIPGNMGPDNRGRMMAWYYRWADLEESDLLTIYVAENEEMSESEMRESIEATLASLGGKNIRLYMMKCWNHFPHVDTAALQRGFYTQLERAQGKYGIYFAGEIMNFPTLENCIIYAKALVERYF